MTTEYDIAVGQPGNEHTVVAAISALRNSVAFSCEGEKVVTFHLSPFRIEVAPGVDIDLAAATFLKALEALSKV